MFVGTHSLDYHYKPICILYTYTNWITTKHMIITGTKAKTIWHSKTEYFLIILMLKEITKWNYEQK